MLPALMPLLLPHPTLSSLACLVLALLLSACGAAGPRRGAPGSYSQSLDSFSNTCGRNPMSCPEGLAASQRSADFAASVVAAGRILDAALQQSLEQLMLECALQADFAVNERHFGGNPTPQQCAEVVGKDSQGNPVTRAMVLGREKHLAALACVQQKLDSLRPGGFSLNQRYRYNPATGRWEPLSRSQVQALLRAGGQALIGTLEPDVVIHTGLPAEVLDAYDFKFPCPGSKPATWRQYSVGHPHHPKHQGVLYEEAFGVNPAKVAPRWGVTRLREPR